ncbi:MAG: hypothetical protein ACRDY2_01315 [Acidimicrobiales bacterium]
MATCTLCYREMTQEVSCAPDPLVIHNRFYEPIRWGDERHWPTDGRAACGDCGAPPGGVHHHGCDIEECPACRRQAISCGCQDEPEGWPDLDIA